jgi:hypothetical protein
MSRSRRLRHSRKTKRHSRRRVRHVTRRRYIRGGFGPGSTIADTNGPFAWGSQPSTWPGANGDHSGTYFKPSPLGIPSGAFQPPVIANGPLNTIPYPPVLHEQKGGGLCRQRRSRSRRHMKRRGGGGISLVEDGAVFFRNIGNTMGNVLRGFQGVTPSISPSPTDQPIAREAPLINTAPQAPIDFKKAASDAIDKVNAV